MNPIPLKKWLPHNGPLIIAGPCSAETEQQVLEVANAFKNNKEHTQQVHIFRAGIWKPRTRPNAFEGVGEKGLPWLKKVKELTGLPTMIEVATAKHVELALLHGIDMLWIGARTTVNPFSVQEIADALRGTGVPVFVKNPINAELSLWIGALERVERAGINKLVAIHRGFSTYEKSEFRNQPLWKLPLELKRQFPDLAIICDPSHITGKSSLIPKVAQKALDIGLDGLMIETHPRPAMALSDASQQVTPIELFHILSQLEIKTEHGIEGADPQHSLELLRNRIDRLDFELIETLANRMKIVEDIADFKIKNKVTAFQVSRLNEMLDKRNDFAKSLKLTKDYVEQVFSVVHDESVRVQTELMESHLPEEDNTICSNKDIGSENTQQIAK